MKKQKTGWKLLLVLTMLVMCVGCGAKKNTSGSVSMYDLRTAMEAADPDLPEMLNASSTEKDAEDKFSHISDMDYKKVDSYFISCICSINNSIRNCIYGIKRNKRGGFHKETTLFCTEIKTF